MNYKKRNCKEPDKSILIDINHIPQFNFFKNYILSLPPNTLQLLILDRGRLRSIVDYELSNIPYKIVGHYPQKKGKFRFLFRFLIPRLIHLLFVIKKKNTSVVITASSGHSNFIARLKGIPNFAINDDPRKFGYQLLRWSTDTLYLPIFAKVFKRLDKNVEIINALKEWAYLSPAVFKPDIKILEKYNLKPYEYYFIREVSTVSLNYANQVQDKILSVADFFPKDKAIVLSLENKENVNAYPSDWIILEEPVNDIHSLMFYSNTIISSGDSVAREGAILGRPTFYCGDREMPANKVMINLGFLEKLSPSKMIQQLKNQKEIDKYEQQSRIQILKNEWIDINWFLQKIHNRIVG